MRGKLKTHKKIKKWSKKTTVGRFFASFFNFFVCFYFFENFQQNQKKHQKQNLKKQHQKNPKIQFLIVFIKIFTQKQFLKTEFELSEPSGTPNHQKLVCKQYYVAIPAQKSKNILTIFIFFLSPVTLLTLPIDRSRSQLLISFFLASLRFI